VRRGERGQGEKERKERFYLIEYCFTQERKTPSSTSSSPATTENRKKGRVWMCLLFVYLLSSCFPPFPTVTALLSLVLKSEVKKIVFGSPSF
jgi:hypothetical protein